MKELMKETVFLPPAVKINMDNYKPYDNIHELRDKAKEYLNSLKGTQYSLEESNPQIKFYISNSGIGHLLTKSGMTKLIITRQLAEILKQGYVEMVEDDRKGRTNIEHVLRCASQIFIFNKLYEFWFILKMEKGGSAYLYDGSIDIKMEE